MTIGKIEPFNLSSKQWPAYIRRVNQYIKLNEIKDDVKVSMLITVVGEAVLARDYRQRGDKWTEAKIVKKTGPVSYKVDVGNGLEWRRHTDQIIPTGNKNRYSLSRMSRAEVKVDVQSGKDEREVDMGAEDDMFEDASSGDENVRKTSPEPILTGSERSPSRCQRDGGGGSVAGGSLVPNAPTALAPPPPDASARALRAYKRAKQAK